MSFTRNPYGRDPIDPAIATRLGTSELSAQLIEKIQKISDALSPRRFFYNPVPPTGPLNGENLEQYAHVLPLTAAYWELEVFRLRIYNPSSTQTGRFIMAGTMNNSVSYAPDLVFFVHYSSEIAPGTGYVETFNGRYQRFTPFADVVNGPAFGVVVPGGAKISYSVENVINPGTPFFTQVRELMFQWKAVG